MVQNGLCEIFFGSAYTKYFVRYALIENRFLKCKIFGNFGAVSSRGEQQLFVIIIFTVMLSVIPFR